MAALAEFERDLLRARVRSGIAAARTRGVAVSAGDRANELRRIVSPQECSSSSGKASRIARSVAGWA